MPDLPQQPWSLPGSEILTALQVDPASGLSDTESTRRLQLHGPNRLREFAQQSAWRILFDQLKSLIVALLAAAAIISFTVGQHVEATAILVVIALNTAIGFFTELKALRSMEALRRLGSTKTVVRRGGSVRAVDADTLVPGDIVILDAGDTLTADLRIIDGSKLQADESTLTGESVPAAKHPRPVTATAVLAERANMLFKGTFITRGSGAAVVVGTGMNTELGEISSLVEQASQDEDSPLEKHLARLGKKLIGVTLGITAAVVALGIVQGKDTILMIETGVALAVAAIPEGLPIVATIALARGMLRLAQRNVLIRRLSAVETLGATTVICTDKTGTLTRNRMTVTRLALHGGTLEIRDLPSAHADADELRDALEIGALCNNASLASQPGTGDPASAEGTGDPVEVALLVAAHHGGIAPPSLAQQFPEQSEVAFDPDVKMMATYHQADGALRVAVKGAPESVLAACTHVRTGHTTTPLDPQSRQHWENTNRQLASLGLRVLALASKSVATTGTEPYADLTLAGLAAMEDPPRDDVKPAIQACRQAGIRVVMVTGDQPDTARHIAREIGLTDPDHESVVTGSQIESGDATPQQIADAPVLARVSPKQKLDLIDLHQQRGEVVAMTGDGVNDAPALQSADIGVAMGVRGTQVAREASDMVLGDDALSSIVTAVGLGRVIFGNIRKFAVYLLSCNTSEILVVGLASLVNAPLPILPLQILFLNLVTDVFPALALGVGSGDPEVMKRPPRNPSEPLLPARLWWGITGFAIAISTAVLAAFAAAILGLGMTHDQAVTVSFLTLAFAQLWHVYNMRDPGSHPLRNDILQNRVLWAALALCVVILMLAVHVPTLSTVLGTVPIGWRGWTLTLAMSTLPVLFGAIARLVTSARNRRPSAAPGPWPPTSTHPT